jgi:hypothetical protein
MRESLFTWTTLRECLTVWCNLEMLKSLQGLASVYVGIASPQTTPLATTLLKYNVWPIFLCFVSEHINHVNRKLNVWQGTWSINFEKWGMLHYSFTGLRCFPYLIVNGCIRYVLILRSNILELTSCLWLCKINKGSWSDSESSTAGRSRPFLAQYCESDIVIFI